MDVQIEMQRKLEEKDRQIADLRRQLAAKDRVMETQRAVLEEASQTFSPALRAKVEHLYHVLTRTDRVLTFYAFSLG